MKIQTQTGAHLIKLAELIDDINVAMLTTTGTSGDLESRPMAPQEMDGDGVIWFITANHSEKTKHLDHVNLSLMHPSRGTYVSVLRCRFLGRLGGMQPQAPRAAIWPHPLSRPARV